MKTKKHIVYLGNYDFPHGFAEVQKITLITKGLILANNTVTVISARGIHNRADYPDLKASGEFQGIRYVYTTGDPFYNPSFLKRLSLIHISEPTRLLSTSYAVFCLKKKT